MIKGQIYKVIAGYYDIKVDGEIFRARGSGKLRFDNESPMVGDFVDFEKDGFVKKIYERNNSMVRPKVANVDQVAIVTSLREPDFNSKILNKMLAVVESKQIKPIIIFTKNDLEFDQKIIDGYKADNYEVYSITNNDKSSLGDLPSIFKDKLTVFTGQTGAGKSTTINSISNFNQETQEISKSLGRGKHTTRVVEILDWAGGRLIDTPGFSSFEVGLDKLKLSKSFKDFRENSSDCQFPRNCLHYKEEKCAIKKLVNEGKISKDRYNDYIKIIQEVDND